MSQETNKGIIYPESGDNPRLWEWFATLAASADAAIPGSVDVQTFEASGTWVKPPGCLFVQVQVQAGGGGSGGCPATDATHGACSGGGGGGEFAQGWFAAQSLPATVPITVGAGGTAGAPGVNNGGPGGNSSFGSLITAVGGEAGVGGVSTTGSMLSNGGLGGAGGNGGTLRVRGSDGGNGMVINTIPVKFNEGGTSFLGGSRRGTTVLFGSSTGFDGCLYGGGASGASNGAVAGNPAVPGNRGGQGVVIVTTFQA